MAELTDKQKRFVEEYLVDLNATQAAIRAGYSKDSANDIGYENLIKPDVQSAIAALKLARSARTKIDADWVLTRLALEVDADLAELYSDTGALKPVSEWPMVWRQGLVAGVETAEEFEEVDGKKRPSGLVNKIKLSDRLKRLELIGKHIAVGAFTEKHEHTGKDGGPIETKLTDSDLARELAFILTTAVKNQKAPE
jgi:phage terminase small subunit